MKKYLALVALVACVFAWHAINVYTRELAALPSAPVTAEKPEEKSKEKPKEKTEEKSAEKPAEKTKEEIANEPRGFVSLFEKQPTPEEFFGVAAWKAKPRPQKDFYEDLYRNRDSYQGAMGFAVAAEQYEKGQGVYLVCVPVNKDDLAYLRKRYTELKDSKEFLAVVMKLNAVKPIQHYQSNWRKRTAVYIPVDNRDVNVAQEVRRQEMDSNKGYLQSMLESATRNIL
jgi:hypothetical protein